MVELLCTLTGIVAGVAIVASLMQKQGERQRFAAEADITESDRILGIADQLQVISHRVAADVSAHSEKVVHISDRLTTPDEEPQRMLSTINEIITANQTMQSQLADAQKRISQQSRMIEHASQQARTDALTGLANRRALNEFLTNSVQGLNDQSLAGLLLMDIDHFKSFNDNFGHTTGDAVLASFARAMLQCCGDSSYAARYGGEEFAVVLTADDAEQLAYKAAEVRYFVSEQTIVYEDLQLKITASGGLCPLVVGDTCSTIYERADEGLYQAKKAGRNRGFWLSSNGWQPFPTKTGLPQLLETLPPLASPTPTLSKAAGERATVQAKQPMIASSQALPTQLAKPVSTTPLDLSMTPNAIDEAETAKAAASNTSTKLVDVLDLNTFIGRLDAFLEQLRKAELPATAFMVEAIGLAQAPASRSGPCWSLLVESIQRKLRGIDVTCLYRPFTLCIFMPGCSLDAGLMRAAQAKEILIEEMAQWNIDQTPERLAVSVAAVGPAEDNASFLNRLEMALDEAVDSSDREVVIHDGNTCHFQQI